jgi:hypothetical protein
VYRSVKNKEESRRSLGYKARFAFLFIAILWIVLDIFLK